MEAVDREALVRHRRQDVPSAHDVTSQTLALERTFAENGIGAGPS
jgi:hypothetical protein